MQVQELGLQIAPQQVEYAGSIELVVVAREAAWTGAALKAAIRVELASPSPPFGGLPSAACLPIIVAARCAAG